MQRTSILSVVAVVLVLPACPGDPAGTNEPRIDAWTLAAPDATTAELDLGQPPDTSEDVGPTDPPEVAARPVVQTVEIRPATGALGERQQIATRYENRFLDPVLEKLRKRDEQRTESAGDETSAIRKRQKETKERKRLEEKRLRSSLPETDRPTSLDLFETVPHNPPVPQYYTGTCWSFASTSFMEAETRRITGKTIKLAEMGTVYGEYLDKATRVIDERGDSMFGEGSETNAIGRVFRSYGALPLASYPGVAEDGLHDHQQLVREMKALLDHLSETTLWDRTTALAMLRVLLDRHLGPRPERFDFEDQTYEPRKFVTEVLQIDPDAYVDVMSTLSVPFHTRGEFEVPDNWWKAAGYHNVPLDEFYAAFKGALEAGFSVAIAIDVSEPGVDASNDVMFVPDYDIPAERIDQLAREYRFAHGLTTDDHAIHVVGHAEFAGHDWYLAKDSGRGARHGKYDGYYFVRDDYIRLKMLAFTVHRDALAAVLAKF